MENLVLLDWRSKKEQSLCLCLIMVLLFFLCPTVSPLDDQGCSFLFVCLNFEHCFVFCFCQKFSMVEACFVAQRRYNKKLPTISPSCCFWPWKTINGLCFVILWFLAFKQERTKQKQKKPMSFLKPHCVSVLLLEHFQLILTKVHESHHLLCCSWSLFFHIFSPYKQGPKTELRKETSFFYMRSVILLLVPEPYYQIISLYAYLFW